MSIQGTEVGTACGLRARPFRGPVCGVGEKRVLSWGQVVDAGVLQTCVSAMRTQLYWERRACLVLFVPLGCLVVPEPAQPHCRPLGQRCLK